MKHLKIFLLLFITLGNSPLYARLQGQAKVDSLLKELPALKDDSNKVNVLDNLALYYLRANTDTSAIMAHRALALSRKIGYTKGVARSLNRLGQKLITNFDTAYLYFRLAINASKEARDTVQLAIAYYHVAYTLESAMNTTGRESVATINKDAIPYIDSAIYTSRSINDTGHWVDALTRKAEILNYLNRMPEAETVLKDAFIINEQFRDSMNIPLYSTLAEFYMKVGKHDSSLKYYKKSLYCAQQRKMPVYLAYQYSQIAVLYAKMGQFAPAVACAELGKKISEENHLFKEYMDNLNALYRVYKDKKDYKKALVYYELLMARSDSINAATLSGNTASFNNQLEAERNKERITVLLKDREIQASTAAKQRVVSFALVSGLVLLVVLAFVIYNRYKLKQKALQSSEDQNVVIRQEKKRSDDLLLNILPEEVAEELKANGTTTARHYDNVTVLFTDFVNFTEAGERMSPQGLIAELHSCFKKFDEITGKYNIEKIKTIGDAYLAVCGLPSPDPIHAENIVRAAIEINSFMQDKLAKMGEKTFRIRIGIHSGSVVAGIVGVKKFAYDIWGDTVNTAARMEQSSEAGKINISETTYELVKDKFACEYRGEMEAKGKGVMKMYFAR